MAKHDPTRQHKEMYHEINSGGTGHTVAHKDLNAKAPAEFNRFPIGYSQTIDKVNFKSPTQIHQIDGFKSHHGNLEKKTSHMPNTAGSFPESMIPNTKPKTPHTSVDGPVSKHQHKSKSMIFHG